MCDNSNEKCIRSAHNLHIPTKGGIFVAEVVMCVFAYYI